VCVCTGCGGGAIVECVGAGTEADVGAGTGAETGAAVETAPVLNDTYLSATNLPERNLAAERWEEGEEEGLSTSLALERLSLRVERTTRSRLGSPKREHPEPSLSRS